MIEKNTCGNCIAWTADYIQSDLRLQGYGQCLMFPPAVIFSPAPRGGAQITTTYPVIERKFTACLQWQPAEISEEQKK